MALGATSSSSLAQSTGILYACDTASGHFSELVLPTPSGAFIVEGKVTVRAVAAIKDWVPVTRISISARPPKPGEDSAEVAGFALTALPQSKLKKGAGKGLIQFVSWDERHAGSTIDHPALGLSAAPQELAFRLLYDGEAVTVRIGDHEKRLTFQNVGPVVRVICSTGEFLYTDLTITSR